MRRRGPYDVAPFAWHLSSVRNLERLFRRRGDFDRADNARQYADAMERTGEQYPMSCLFPHRAFRVYAGDIWYGGGAG